MSAHDSAMGKISTVSLWIFLALISCSVIKILLILDYNKKIYDHLPGPCQKIQGIRFSVTDVELLPDGHAIISSGYDKILIADAKKKRKGRLYAFDLSSVQNLNKTLTQAAVEIKLVFDTTTGPNFNDQGRFNPIALSSYISKNVINLYVVNSMIDYDTVECFVYDKNAKTATHMKTIKDDNIYSAYDIKAYDPDKFFLTNQFYFRSRLLNYIEIYLLFNLGNLIHFDGKKSTVVDSRLTTPRGLALDINGTHLYMSMGLQESVRVYNMHRDSTIDKHVSTTAPSEAQPENVQQIHSFGGLWQLASYEISLLTTANKLSFDFDSGDLYIAAFPILHEALSLKIYSALGKTSSHVLRVKLQDKEVRQWVINEMLANSGSMISGSEVAVYYHSLLIVGTLGGKLMICEAPITETY